MPCTARIASSEAADGLGTVALAEGSTLRFGRSACRGLEPVVDARVIVSAIAAHPRGGFRATAMTLDPADSSYDQRLAARDAALGVKPPADPVQTAAATSQVLGRIVVLLEEAPPTGPQAFRAWAEAIGLPAKGIRVTTEGALKLGIGAQDALAYVGPGPFPADRLADFGVPEGLPHRGFIGLSLGLPDLVPRSANRRRAGRDRGRSTGRCGTCRASRSRSSRQAPRCCSRRRGRGFPPPPSARGSAISNRCRGSGSCACRAAARGGRAARAGPSAKERARWFRRALVSGAGR